MRVEGRALVPAHAQLCAGVLPGLVGRTSAVVPLPKFRALPSAIGKRPARCGCACGCAHAAAQDRTLLADTVRRAADCDLGDTVAHVHESVERSGVLAEALLVEGERRHCAGLLLDDLPAHDRSGLVGRELERIAAGELVLRLVLMRGPRQETRDADATRRFSVRYSWASWCSMKSLSAAAELCSGSRAA